MPRLVGPDPALPGLILRADALDAGLTPDQVRHRVRSQRWQRIARGAYLSERALADAADDWERARLVHVQQARAAVRRNPAAVIGYGSAAYLHGLPVLGPVPREVTLVVPPDRWTGRRSGIVFRSLRLLDEHIECRPDPVTTPGRTWLDMACRGSLADALVAGDAGLRSGTLAPDAVLAVLESVDRLPGIGRAEAAVPLLDGCRETPLESASYAYVVERRLPRPRMQVSISDEDGFVGRVDFLWEGGPTGHGVVGESDGAVKYGTPGELYKEKRREDRLRALGLTVVRWGMVDLRGPALAERLRRLAIR